MRDEVTNELLFDLKKAAHPGQSSPAVHISASEQNSRLPRALVHTQAELRTHFRFVPNFRTSKCDQAQTGLQAIAIAPEREREYH